MVLKIIFQISLSRSLHSVMETLYIATYSGCDVFELLLATGPVMRRAADGWVNATQLLKAAGLPKPQRTKVLERDVHPATHEKVQGGHGRFQGTWVPLETAQYLAQRFCPDLLHDLLNYNPQTDPPLARRDAKKKQRRKKQPPADPQQNQVSGTTSAEAIPTIGTSQRRISPPAPQLSQAASQAAPVTASLDQQLLSFFVSDNSAIPAFLFAPPPHFDPDEAIDDEGHTALHWACSLAQPDVVQLLLNAGANPHILNNTGTNPLGKLVCFTNAHDTGVFPQLLQLNTTTGQPFGLSLVYQDGKGQTTIHHILQMLASQDNTLVHIEDSTKVQALNYYLYQSLLYLHNTNKLSLLNDIHDYQGMNIWSLAQHLGLDNLLHSVVNAVATTTAASATTAAGGLIYPSDTVNVMDISTSTHIFDSYNNNNQSSPQFGSTTPMKMNEDDLIITKTTNTAIPGSQEEAHQLLADLKTYPKQLSKLAESLSSQLNDQMDTINHLTTSISSIDTMIQGQDSKISKLSQQHMLSDPDEIYGKFNNLQHSVQEKLSILMSLLERYQALNIANLVNQLEEKITHNTVITPNPLTPMPDEDHPHGNEHAHDSRYAEHGTIGASGGADDQGNLEERLTKSVQLSKLQLNRQFLLNCLIQCDLNFAKVNYVKLISNLCDVSYDGINKELLDGLESFLS